MVVCGLEVFQYVVVSCGSNRQLGALVVSHLHERTFTARAATSPTVSNDALASIVKRILLLELKGMVSVGENAVAFVNDTKK